MKKAIILGSALSIVGLMLVSCSSEPGATSTTTRQTTVSTAASQQSGAAQTVPAPMGPMERPVSAPIGH